MAAPWLRARFRARQWRQDPAPCERREGAQRPWIRSLGPDPLRPGFDEEAAAARILGWEPSKRIGAALLDQSLLAGIGNVIRIEALWLSQVSPWRPIADLTEPEAAALVTHNKWVMETAIAKGEPPEKIDGRSRSRRPCPRCGGRIRPTARGTTTALPTGARAARSSSDAGDRPVPSHARSDLAIIIAGMRGGDRRDDDRAVGSRAAALLLLPQTELDRIAQVAVPRMVPKGARAFTRAMLGATPATSSAAARFASPASTSTAAPSRSATLGSGEIVGELAMLDGEVRSASVEALSDIELLAYLAARDMRGLLERNPEITAKLVVALTRRVP